MLQEAPTVSKAIERAWLEAGRPTVFTIKILEEGERSFLGIVKQQAVISIAYETKKQVEQKTAQIVRRVPEKKKEPIHPKKKENHEVKNTSQHKKQEQKKEQKKEQNNNNNKVFSDYWNEMLVGDITTWLQELVSIIGIESQFTTKSEKSTLRITFEQNLLKELDSEKMLCVGFSNLLLQFLKKKHKRKFKGFRLMLTSKRMQNDTKPTAQEKQDK